MLFSLWILFIDLFIVTSDCMKQIYDDDDVDDDADDDNLLSCQHLSRRVIDQRSRVMLLCHTAPVLHRRMSALLQVLSQDRSVFSPRTDCTYIT